MIGRSTSASFSSMIPLGDPSLIPFIIKYLAKYVMVVSCVMSGDGDDDMMNGDDYDDDSGDGDVDDFR